MLIKQKIIVPPKKTGSCGIWWIENVVLSEVKYAIFRVFNGSLV